MHKCYTRAKQRKLGASEVTTVWHYRNLIIIIIMIIFIRVAVTLTNSLW